MKIPGTNFVDFRRLKIYTKSRSNGHKFFCERVIGPVAIRSSAVKRPDLTQAHRHSTMIGWDGRRIDTNDAGQLLDIGPWISGGIIQYDKGSGAPGIGTGTFEVNSSHADV